MTLKRIFTWNTFRLWAGMGTAIVLTGCPLTDKYYIEQNSVGGNTSQGGMNGGSIGVGVGVGAATNLGGRPGSAGAALVPCEANTCTGTCCNSGCSDVLTDANNCGACGNACPVGRNCRAGKCYGWTTMAAPPVELVAREKAAYVAMGERLFVFGGLDANGNALNSGGIYDPATDTWTMLPQTDATPSPRQLASAFWSGLRVFVMGGRDASSALAYADGGRFDPDPTTWDWFAAGALSSGRVAPWGAPSASYLMLWGGLSATDTAVSGGERAAYTITGTNVWTAITAGTYGGVTPDRVTDAAWGYTSTLAYLFGGRTTGTGGPKTNKGYYYTATSNSWTAMSTGPSGRWGSFGTCDGTAFYTWGGRDDSNVMGDGYRYGANWTTLGVANAPAARWAPFRRTGWAFSFAKDDVAIIGGMDLAGVPLTDGGRYNRAADTWSTIDAWPSREAHEYAAAVLLKGEIFVWGGRNGATLTTTGERWLP